MVGIGKGDRDRVLEDRGRFLEGNAMFLQVIVRFPLIPFKVHGASISQT